MRAIAVPPLAAALLAALPALAQPRVIVDPGLAASDAALLQDPTKATAELQRRLRDQVTYKDGLLVIVDRSGTTAGVTVMPATVTWGIDCSDSGLAITFGSGSGDTDNGVVLQLTSAAITDAKCAEIAPAVGETALAITKGN
jgi:hypothetical protein